MFIITVVFFISKPVFQNFWMLLFFNHPNEIEVQEGSLSIYSRHCPKWVSTNMEIETMFRRDQNNSQMTAMILLLLIKSFNMLKIFLESQESVLSEPSLRPRLRF